MDYEYIDDIVSEMLNESFSVFCGAGANYDATNKTWIDLFDDITKSFYEDRSSDIYFLADLEKQYYNKDNFETNIKRALENVKNLESEHINNIINLNINQIWTTNFDNIIEETINRKLGFYPTVIKETADLLARNLNSRYIVYKLNGCVTKFETMVLTKSDYFQYLKKERLLFEVLKRQLVLNSFLFIGYSFSDDLVLSALREIKEVFPNSNKTHYRFCKKNDSETDKYYNYESEYYRDTYGINTIFVNEYSDIDLYLQKLYKKFCTHNVFISGSFRQLKNNNERIYVETLTSSLIDKLTNDNYRIYSGNGRGLGEIVVAQVVNKNKEAQFVNRPLIFTNTTVEEKNKNNKLIMKDCDTMIIICGQDDSLKSSANVKNQFQQFLNQKYRLVIPIPSTQYAAKEIFDSEKFKNSSCYLTNEDSFKKLEETSDIEHITNIVLNIIKSYK